MTLTTETITISLIAFFIVFIVPVLITIIALFISIFNEKNL